MFSIIEQVISGLATLIAAAVGFSIFRQLRSYLSRKASTETFSDRLSGLISNLASASGQVDSILRELSMVAKEKEGLVTKLEGSLRGLENREQELRKRIEILQGVPLPVAEQFARLVAPSEKRSARRDYTLFGAGVVSTIIISIIIQLIAK